MKPVFYILMRSDLASLNPGKAMAQAAHAATAFERHIINIRGFDPNVELPDTTVDEQKSIDLYDMWSGSTIQGFGTKIVLDVDNEKNIHDTIREAEINGFPFGDVIHDPTYPIRDGNVTHFLPINTCGYVFTDAEKWFPSKFNLYK